MKKKQTNKIHTEPTLHLPFATPTTNPGFFQRIHMNILDLNGSKFFAGFIMIMLNVGSKFIPIQFSKSAEEYLKKSLSKVILVFAMSWMGTRDIYTAILLTVLFVIFSDYLFNEESMFCIVPHDKRILESINGTSSSETKDPAKQTLELIANTRKKIDSHNK
jgi:hypothetical protein